MSNSADKLTLVLGYKNYSSWSMRPYLAMKAAGLAFDEIVIPLDRPETPAQLRAHSPTAKVPVLKHGETVIWDSLAICEYAHELAPRAQLWPEQPRARAQARSVAAEMHSGFVELRRARPMNVRARFAAQALPEVVAADVARIDALWSDCRARHGGGGDFLFGRFSIADAMFGPVVSRFVTYAVPLSTPSRAYIEAMAAFPPMRQWTKDAAGESWSNDKYDKIFG